MIKESHLRSITKAVSWRIFATLTTMIITYLITHEWAFALYVGLFEFISKIGLFYLHERLWGIIPFGLNSYNKKNFVNNEITTTQ
jgi:adenylylsulfate kinase